MNNADKIIKRCRALALAGVLGLTSLGSPVTALAAGPGEDASRDFLRRPGRSGK